MTHHESLIKCCIRICLVNVMVDAFEDAVLFDSVSVGLIREGLLAQSQLFLHFGW